MFWKHKGRAITVALGFFSLSISFRSCPILPIVGWVLLTRRNWLSSRSSETLRSGRVVYPISQDGLSEARAAAQAALPHLRVFDVWRTNSTGCRPVVHLLIPYIPV